MDTCRAAGGRPEYGELPTPRRRGTDCRRCHTTRRISLMVTQVTDRPAHPRCCHRSRNARAERGTRRDKEPIGKSCRCPTAPMSAGHRPTARSGAALRCSGGASGSRRANASWVSLAVLLMGGEASPRRRGRSAGAASSVPARLDARTWHRMGEQRDGRVSAVPASRVRGHRRSRQLIPGMAIGLTPLGRTGRGDSQRRRYQARASTCGCISSAEVVE